jgi:hypothetical protein
MDVACFSSWGCEVKSGSLAFQASGKGVCIDVFVRQFGEAVCTRILCVIVYAMLMRLDGGAEV